MMWTSLFLCSSPTTLFKANSLLYPLIPSNLIQHSRVMDKIQGHSDSHAPLGQAGDRAKPLCFPVLHVHTSSDSLSENLTHP